MRVPFGPPWGRPEIRKVAGRFSGSNIEKIKRAAWSLGSPSISWPAFFPLPCPFDVPTPVGFLPVSMLAPSSRLPCPQRSWKLPLVPSMPWPHPASLRCLVPIPASLRYCAFRVCPHLMAPAWDRILGWGHLRSVGSHMGG